MFYGKFLPQRFVSCSNVHDYFFLRLSLEKETRHYLQRLCPFQTLPHQLQPSAQEGTVPSTQILSTKSKMSDESAYGLMTS